MKLIKNKKLHTKINKINKIKKNSVIKLVGGSILCKKSEEELKKCQLIIKSYLPKIKERDNEIETLKPYENSKLIEKIIKFNELINTSNSSLKKEYQTILNIVQKLKELKTILTKYDNPKQYGGLNLFCNKIQQDIIKCKSQIKEIYEQIKIAQNKIKIYQNLFNEIKIFEIKIREQEQEQIQKTLLINNYKEILQIVESLEKTHKLSVKNLSYISPTTQSRAINKLNGREVITLKNSNPNNLFSQSLAIKSKLPSHILPTHISPHRVIIPRQLPKTISKIFQNAKLIRGIYNPNYKFSEWVIDENKWKDFKFNETKVYYNEDDNLQKVKLMVKQREPVNVNKGMRREYNQFELKKQFGYSIGAYSKSTKTELMPNIAIYCDATVKNPDKSKEEYVNAHVINLVGYAFDNIEQPDFIYFKNKYLNKKYGDNLLGFKKELIEKYRKIWMLACHAAKDKGLKYLCLYNVGGSEEFTNLLQEFNFIYNLDGYVRDLIKIPKENEEKILELEKEISNLKTQTSMQHLLSTKIADFKKKITNLRTPSIKINNLPREIIKKKTEEFINQIFKPSFYTQQNDKTISPQKFCQDNNIRILHENLEDEENWKIPDLLFNGTLEFKPNSIEDDPATLENTLFVNSLNPWSLIGNGNDRDNSLNGFWGRSSNMSVLGWTFTNKTLERDYPYYKVSRIQSLQKVNSNTRKTMIKKPPLFKFNPFKLSSKK